MHDFPPGRLFAHRATLLARIVLGSLSARVTGARGRPVKGAPLRGRYAPLTGRRAGSGTAIRERVTTSRPGLDSSPSVRGTRFVCVGWAGGEVLYPERQRFAFPCRRSFSCCTTADDAPCSCRIEKDTAVWAPHLRRFVRSTLISRSSTASAQACRSMFGSAGSRPPLASQAR